MVCQSCAFDSGGKTKFPIVTRKYMKDLHSYEVCFHVCNQKLFWLNSRLVNHWQKIYLCLYTSVSANWLRSSLAEVLVNWIFFLINISGKRQEVHAAIRRSETARYGVRIHVSPTNLCSLLTRPKVKFNKQVCTVIKGTEHLW